MSHRALWALLAAALQLGLLCAPLTLLGILGPAARDVAVVLLTTLATGWVMAEVALQSPEEFVPDAAHGQGGGGSWLAALGGLGILAIFLLGLVQHGLDARPSDPLAVGAGSAFLAAGAALRCAAVLTLGRYFVTEARVAPGQSLMVTGIFRWIRHPSETGLLAIGLGAALLLQSSAALATWVFVLAPSALARARREDALLRKEFREAHREYTVRVGGLLPRPCKPASVQQTVTRTLAR